MRFWRSSLAFGAAAALTTACTENRSEPTSPDFITVPTEPVCQVIDFNEFEHGGNINSLSTIFGFNLTVTTAGNPTFSANQAVAFDTDVLAHPDADLRVNGTCTACAGLDKVMIILDNRGFALQGDSPSGGTVTLTGFSGGNFYVDGFTAIDQDAQEASLTLDADGVEIGSSGAPGADGNVKVVPTLNTLFSSNLVFTFAGSGAVDNLKICQEPEEQGGGEGCTPGYWKQEHHFDSWPAPYQPNQLFSVYFDDAFPGQTLLEVLSAGGGGLTALGRHTVAALLNAASGDVSYDLTTSEVIAMFNAAFPGGDYETLKNEFADFNEQSCPLN